MISNLITLTRIVLLAPLFWCVVHAGVAEHWTALGLLVLAALSDIIDGRVARALGETSRLGAMLDLIADRLLTLVVVGGLIAGGQLTGISLVAGLVLVARDLLVASFGESVPDLGLTSSAVEKIKIALQFLAFAFLIAPPVIQVGRITQLVLGDGALTASALVACLTVVSYGRLVVLHLSGRDTSSPTK